MLDISLFRDRRFSAAAAAVTVAFFALFGFIFLITQYFQFVRDYSPLGTGLRILPVAIGHRRVLGRRRLPRAADRHEGRGHHRPRDARVVVPVDLRRSTVDVVVPGAIVPQMLLMGLGLGLITTPATESILQVLPPARAGVGSAVNDATRELGGTLGVAVVGSLFSSLYAARLVELLDGRLDRRPAGGGRGLGRGRATRSAPRSPASPRRWRTRSWSGSRPAAW